MPFVVRGFRVPEEGQPSMIDVVYAKSNGFIDLPTGARVKVPFGSHWAKDDPAVRARPDMFSADTRYGMLFTREPAGYDAPEGAFESATANPGERRSVRRAS